MSATQLDGLTTFVDSHCHLDRLDLSAYNGDLSSLIQNARAHHVKDMLCVSISFENVDRCVQIAKDHDFVHASIGVHPSDVNTVIPPEETWLRYQHESKVVAIGETGLDYYYGIETKKIQNEAFAFQIDIAKKMKKPLIVHTRQAKEDTLSLLKAHQAHEVGGVLHCFTEDQDMAFKALDLGFYISFSGIITFKNAEDLRAVANALPIDRILIETDSPYLAPIPFRGRSNEPRWVVEVAKKMAEIRGVSLEEIAEKTTENFHRLFLNK